MFVVRVEFIMKFFWFVICSLVIYGCFEGDVVKIEVDNVVFKEKINKVGGEGNGIVILEEGFVDELYVEIRMKREIDGGKEKYFGYNGDDEDGENEIDGLGSGDEEEYV